MNHKVTFMFTEYDPKSLSIFLHRFLFAALSRKKRITIVIPNGITK